jgi:hypothetical protein
MFNSPSPPRPASTVPKAPPPGSIPQPRLDDLPHETVPDWNNIGLFTAGIALGAILGASVALLWAPASGEETRERIGRRVRGQRDEEDVWDELAKELELAVTESEADAEEEEVLDALKT